MDITRRQHQPLSTPSAATIAPLNLLSLSTQIPTSTNNGDGDEVISVQVKEGLMCFSRCSSNCYCECYGATVCGCTVNQSSAIQSYLKRFHMRDDHQHPPTTLGSRDQLAIADFAEAFLIIPKVLAASAEKDGTDLVAQLHTFCHNITLYFWLIEQHKCLLYWAVYGSFSVGEIFLDKYISRFPLYYQMKLAFLTWLQIPTTNFQAKFVSAHQREFQFMKTMMMKFLCQ